MAATTITRSTWTDGSSGTLIDNAALGTDIYDRIDALFLSAFTFGDLVHSDGFGTFDWTAAGTGGQILNLQNSTGGTGNFSAVHLGNDADADMGRLEAYSSSYTETGAIKQDGVALRNVRDGGVSIAAEHASGAVRLYAAGTSKIATFDGDLHTLSGGTQGTQVLSGVLSSSVNTTGVGTDANTTEKDLHTFSLPAGTLASDGQMIRATFFGSFAANANGKRIRTYFGATEVGNKFGTQNDGGWTLVLTVIRTGATTQDCAGSGSAIGSSTDEFTTAAETLSGAVTVKVTGENSTSSANDIVCEGSFVEFLG